MYTTETNMIVAQWITKFTQIRRSDKMLFDEIIDYDPSVAVKLILINNATESEIIDTKIERYSTTSSKSKGIHAAITSKQRLPSATTVFKTHTSPQLFETNIETMFRYTKYNDNH